MLGRVKLAGFALAFFVVALLSSGIAQAAPSNDNFADAATISVGTPVSGSNDLATEESGEPSHFPNNYARRSIWWKFTPVTRQLVVVDATEGQDVAGERTQRVLSVYTGNAVNALTWVATGADIDIGNKPKVSFEAIPGTTYYIVIDGVRIGDGMSSPPAWTGPVSLVINAAMSVTPTAMQTTTAPYAGAASPSSFSYTVTAASQTSFMVMSSSYPDWLQLDPPHLDANYIQTDATVTFSVKANAALRTPGTYEDQIVFFSPQGPMVRKVKLIVRPSFEIVTGASPPWGGTTSGDGRYLANSLRTVTATPASGYRFAKWINSDNATLSTSRNYAFRLTAAANITAVFEQDVYSVSVSPSPAQGGFVDGGGTFVNGSTRTVTATPNSGNGFKFVNWTEAGKVISTTESYSFQVTANRSLVANFVLANNTIAVSAWPAKAGTVTGGGTFLGGTARTVTATAKTGFQFLNWTEGGKQVAIEPSYTFLLSANRTLRANFKPIHAIKNDLLVDRGTQGLWLFKNNSQWQKIHSSRPTAIAAGDLNGDGKDEIIFGIAAPAAQKGTWSRVATGAAAANIHPNAVDKVAVGDFDNDGKDDLVATFSGVVGTYARVNNGAWAKIHNTSALQVAAADLNGDKKSDLLVGLPTGLWVSYDAGKTWNLLHASRPSSIATGNFDTNGKADVVVGLGAQGTWKRANDAGPWVKINSGDPSLLTTGDLDGNNTDGVLAALPSGLWSSPVANAKWVKLNTVVPVGLATSDLDGNGKDEVVAIFGALLQARMNNAGAWRVIQPPAPAAAPRAIIGGSFD